MLTKTVILWLAVLLGLGLLLLAWLGRKTVHTELSIPAPPEAVWSVLMDSAGYSQWNPVFARVEGEFRLGASMTYQMVDGKGQASTVKSKVVELAPERLLNQFGGLPGILTFDHRWTLEPVPGGTLVTQHEVYRGLGIWFWDESWVEPAYARANEALRDRVLQ